jgi:hypothetical protein
MQTSISAKGLLALLVAGACLATSAEARHRRSWKWTEPTSVAIRSPTDATMDNERGPREPHLIASPARFRSARGISLVIDRLIRGCQQQSIELANWPFGTIANVVAPDQDQSAALDQLRLAAQGAADALTTTCPQVVPAEPSAQLEAVEQAIDAAGGAFAAVQPALQGFYAKLDDEQKARLLRDMGARESQDQASRNGRSRRYAGGYRSTSAPRGERSRAAPTWGMICEHLTVALRSWPIRDVERNVRLSDVQRVSFFELVTTSLKTADTLAATCPADNALTPSRRIELLRQRLAAVREATAAIRPALLRFLGTLDQQQQVRFAGLS